MIRRFVLLVVVLLLAACAANAYAQVDSLRIRKVHPTGALFRSAIIPGWGQLYNRKYLKALIFLGGEGYLVYSIRKDWKEADRHEANFRSAFDDPAYQAIEFNKYQDSRDARNLKMWILAATVFYSMFDAYVDAQLANFNQADKSFDVYIGPDHRGDFAVSLTFAIP